MERIQELAKEASAIMEEVTGMREGATAATAAATAVVPKKRVAILTPTMTSPVAPGDEPKPKKVFARPPIPPASATTEPAAATAPAPTKKKSFKGPPAPPPAVPPPAPPPPAAPAPEPEKKKSFKGPPTDPSSKTKPKTIRVAKEPVDFATFVKSRHKDPSKYVFTKEGDVGIRDGEKIKTIAVLPSYRAPNPTEIAELEAAQESTLEEILSNIETTKKELRDAIMTYRTSKDGADIVVSLNERITELMKEKSAAEYPLRWVEVNRRENISDILLEEEFEKRKTAYEIVYLKRRTKTLQSEYVREYDPSHTEELVAATLATKRKGVTVFSSKEEENGALADNWLADIVVDGVEYSSAIQAYYAMKATRLGREDIRVKIMDTRSTKRVRKYAESLTAETEEWLKEREAVLFKIQLAKFEQHAELAKVLDKTGDNKLVYANALEKELGIGLAPTDPRLDEGRWLGKNVLGEVLVKVRARLREGRAGEGVATTAPVREKAISEAQDAARTKAIIARRTVAKRGGFGGFSPATGF